MLVLTRKAGEVIRIGDDVRIVVLRSRSDELKLGIDAPQSVRVYREEIYQRIQREREAAGDPGGPAT